MIRVRLIRSHRPIASLCAFVLAVCWFITPLRAADPPKPPWLLATAYKIPSEYTNQESGYFSIVEGKNGRIYLGAARYGVDAYLIEFDPKAKAMKMVVDVHKVIGSRATGFAAQAKIHTRNNVGASGKIYVGSKQGYPEKGEKRDDYPGGYVLTYDPATGQAEHFGIARKHHGIISAMPDEARGVAYVSTCADSRPVESSHFMILDLAKKTYRDLGETEHLYAFIVIDHKGRAYHPVRGGTIARYDPGHRQGRQVVDHRGRPRRERVHQGRCHPQLGGRAGPQDAIRGGNVDERALRIRSDGNRTDGARKEARRPASRAAANGLPGPVRGARRTSLGGRDGARLPRWGRCCTWWAIGRATGRCAISARRHSQSGLHDVHRAGREG